MKIFDRVRNKIKGGLRLHHRMILIYVVGGMIPFISASLYTNAQKSGKHDKSE